MKFWKEHTALRMTLIGVLFVVGLVLTFTGWSMTGQMAGMGLMLLGLALLLVALYIYNKPFQDPH
jgi:peptidoglycan/LPS O-acetylase OafA/YrhL